MLGGGVLHFFGESETVQNEAGPSLRLIGIHVFQTLIYVHQTLLRFWKKKDTKIIVLTITSLSLNSKINTIKTKAALTFLVFALIFKFFILNYHLHCIWQKLEDYIKYHVYTKHKIEFSCVANSLELKKAEDLGKFVNILFELKTETIVFDSQFKIDFWYKKYNTMIISGSQNLWLPFQHHLLLVDLNHTLESGLIIGLHLPPQVINVYVLRYGKFSALQCT